LNDENILSSDVILNLGAKLEIGSFIKTHLNVDFTISESSNSDVAQLGAEVSADF